MHIAEVVTIAKSLPLLRLNTYKSLILSYSADYRRIFGKNPPSGLEIGKIRNAGTRSGHRKTTAYEPFRPHRRRSNRPKTSAETVPATTAARKHPQKRPLPQRLPPAFARTRHPCRTTHATSAPHPPGTRAAEGFAHARSDSSARASFSRSASSIFRSR